MTITLKDIQHLELMASLETKEAPKVDAAELLPKTKDSKSLDHKLLTLCAQLRAKGFDRQAENLENKFAIYKQATTHLYNTQNEKGEDLIDFAHPEGDVTVEKANKDLADIETIVSQHKKIVDVVKKNPSGKIANPKSDKLEKIGQQTVTLRTISQKFKYMADYLRQNIISKIANNETTNNFLETATKWETLANLIAKELNTNNQLSELDAIHLVKNRLFNNEIANQHAGSINSLPDIDKLINTILNWFEDNKPSDTNKLSAYINDCKIALGIVSLIPTLHFITSYIDPVNRSIEQLTGDVTANLNKLVDKPELKFLRSRMTFVIGENEKLLNELKKYNENKDSTDPNIAKSFQNFLVKHKFNLEGLKTHLKNIFDEEHRGVPGFAQEMLERLFWDNDVQHTMLRVQQLMDTIDVQNKNIDTFLKNIGVDTTTDQQTVRTDLEQMRRVVDSHMQMLQNWKEEIKKKNLPITQQSQLNGFLSQLLNVLNDLKFTLDKDKLTKVEQAMDKFRSEWLQ